MPLICTSRRAVRPVLLLKMMPGLMVLFALWFWMAPERDAQMSVSSADGW
jgi:hypothetical protein